MKMSRVYNFSAGPAVLPEEVLKEVAAEMLDYNGSGMSVMEMSHRSKVFEEILNTAEQDFRDLLKIPDPVRSLLGIRPYRSRTLLFSARLISSSVYSVPMGNPSGVLPYPVSPVSSGAI